MSDIAHLVIDHDGIIVSLDAAFCAIMRGRAEDLVNLDMLAITAPADRTKCAELFARLRTDGIPLRTTKRLMRRDGTHVWVHTRADRAPGAPDPAGQRFVALVEPSTPPTEWVEPERLLQLAYMVRASRRARATVFDPGLFADHAWDILIGAYISEARGRILTAADLHADSGIGLPHLMRWIRALQSQGLIEIERAGGTAPDAAPVRLSACGHARFERYLTDFFGTLIAAAPVPVG